jgi:hypothetical protein
MQIPFAALSPPGNNQAVLCLRQVPKELTGCSFPYLGANRNQEDEIVTAPAGLLFAAAVCASGRLKMSLEVKIEEGLFGMGGFDHHITALAAISPIRTASGNIFLSSKTDAAIAAVSGPNVDLDLINKAHG